MYGQDGPGSPPFVPQYQKKKRLYDSSDVDNPDNNPKPQNFTKPAPQPAVNDQKPGRPPLPNAPEDTLSRDMTSFLARRRAGSINTSFTPEDTTKPKPQGEPADTTPPGQKPFQSAQQTNDRGQAIADVIRRRGPDVNALIQNRRAQMGDRYKKYGPTPTGGDENAPKPPIRFRRRAFNAYTGKYS